MLDNTSTPNKHLVLSEILPHELLAILNLEDQKIVELIFSTTEQQKPWNDYKNLVKDCTVYRYYPLLTNVGQFLDKKSSSLDTATKIDIAIRFCTRILPVIDIKKLNHNDIYLVIRILSRTLAYTDSSESNTQNAKKIIIDLFNKYIHCSQFELLDTKTGVRRLSGNKTGLPSPRFALNLGATMSACGGRPQPSCVRSIR